MRFSAPLCALLCALVLPLAARAAIGIEESTPSASEANVAVQEFSGDSTQYYEKQREFRLQEQRRAKMKSQAKGIALIVAPVALIILLTFLYARSRSEGARRRSTHRKLKQAEGRRRSGGPEQVLDPRQW
jgi:hypothetical protein